MSNPISSVNPLFDNEFLQRRIEQMDPMGAIIRIPSPQGHVEVSTVQFNKEKYTRMYRDGEDTIHMKGVVDTYDAARFYDSILRYRKTCLL